MSVDMTKHSHWAVTVEASGEEIVRLETECYGGRELSAADEDAVRTAAQHLLAFIGDRTFDMIECEAFHAGYEAGERDARAPHPAPVTARDAEPVAWRYRSISDPGMGWTKATEFRRDKYAREGMEEQPLYTRQPQPSETVAEKALLQRAVDLIKGDLMGVEWKRACNAFVKDAMCALKGGA